MNPHVLPTLPEPAPGSHGHEMPPPLPGRYDEPVDLGTGQAAFFIACIVLALTLAMGIVAISRLADRDGLAPHSQRAITIDSGARTEARTPARVSHPKVSHQVETNVVTQAERLPVTLRESDPAAPPRATADDRLNSPRMR